MGKSEGKRWQAGNRVIITSLIVFWPIGFYLLWRRSAWEARTKIVVTTAVSACVVALTVLAVVFAPPTLEITSSLQPQAGANYMLTGTVDSADTVAVNGEAVTVTNGTFSVNMTLNKGNNSIDIVVREDSKEADKRIMIHRYTDAEIAKQRQQGSGEEFHSQDLGYNSQDLSCNPSKNEPCA